MHCYHAQKAGSPPPHASRPLLCISYNVDSAERSQPLSEIDGFHKVAGKHFSFVREGKEVSKGFGVLEECPFVLETRGA